jgi:hypothetical protein
MPPAEFVKTSNACQQPMSRTIDPGRQPRNLITQHHAINHARRTKRLFSASQWHSVSDLGVSLRKKRIEIGETLIDPVHNQIQNRLFELLREKYGSDKVTMEGCFVDITVSAAELDALIEVKSDRFARLAIRAAIGQLLDYACQNQKGRPGASFPQLVVAAPGPLDAEANEFLLYLKERFALSLRYVQADVGMKKSPL